MAKKEYKTEQFVFVGNKFPMYTKTGLAERWNISPQRVQLWENKYDDFPARQLGVVVGSRPVYSYADILKFEEGKGGKDGIASYIAAMGNK